MLQRFVDIIHVKTLILGIFPYIVSYFFSSYTSAPHHVVFIFSFFFQSHGWFCLTLMLVCLIFSYINDVIWGGELLSSQL